MKVTNKKRSEEVSVGKLSPGEAFVETATDECVYVIVDTSATAVPLNYDEALVFGLHSNALHVFQREDEVIPVYVEAVVKG